jgi:hypothetical protein
MRDIIELLLRIGLGTLAGTLVVLLTGITDYPTVSYLVTTACICVAFAI